MKRLIENYPVNQYRIYLYIVPNENGKTHLDSHYGEIIDCNSQNEAVFKLYRLDLSDLRDTLYGMTNILTNRYRPKDLFVPRFNPGDA